jgi:glycerol-1-phosphate dehydrogenase [NAD(P)+]
VQACEPSAIIADLETISKAPYRLIASGFGDLVSNISAVEDWKIADRAGKEKYSMLIGELSLLSAKSVIAHTKEIKKMDYHGLEVQLWSLICSGFAMNLHGSSRPCSGSEHNFAHALDMLGCNVLHGDACGLGTIVSTCLQGGDWQTIKDVLQVAGLPVTAKEIEIDKSVLIEALVRARSIRERYTVLDEKKLAKKSAEDVLKKVGII